MQKLLSAGLWPELSKLAKTARTRRAAIAYATLDHLWLHSGDVLIVDASDNVIRSGGTCAKLLKKLPKLLKTNYAKMMCHLCRFKVASNDSIRSGKS